jgi:hypothetical protein
MNEALKLALEALEKISKTMYHIETPPVESLEEQMRRIAYKAITAIKQALAAPVQEPVFELQKSGWEIICDLDWIQTLPFGTKLYTTPPAAQRQWVGLTVLEQADCFANTEDATEFYHAIEAKLKEKNNG